MGIGNIANKQNLNKEKMVGNRMSKHSVVLPEKREINYGKQEIGHAIKKK